MNTEIMVSTGKLVEFNFSPFAFQWYAKDFYDAYKAYKKVREVSPFSPALLTLLAQAIELAAKSLHVHQGKRDEDLRKLGHDLVTVCDPLVLAKYGINISPDESIELKKMSDLNKAKAFEYFWSKSTKNDPHPEMTGIFHAVKGREGLPNEMIVEGLLIKLVQPDFS